MEVTAQFFGLLYEHASKDSTVEHRSFPNTNGEGRPSRLMSRDLEEIETFLGRNDIKGRGVFFGVATRKAGCTQGRREDLHEIVAVWVDIDTEALGLEKGAAVDLLRGSFRPPTAIIDSGRGIHAYWRLSEAVTVDLECDGGREAGEAIEQVNRQLAHVYAGDTNACDVTRVMRTPGTHNTKDDGWRDCLALYLDGPEHDFGDLSDWLSWQSPLIDRPAGSEAVPLDGNGNPFETYGKQYGGDIAPPMDVGEALDAMTYQGQGNASVHQTQLRVSLSLLGKGWAEDDIVALLLEKTAAAVGDAGRFWNWDAEERALRGMIVSGRTKIGDSVRNIQDSKADLEEGAEAPNWADALKRDQHGKIKPELRNLALILEYVTDLAGCFALNQWTCRIMASRDLPWRSADGELTDSDEVKLRLYAAERYGVEFSGTCCHDAVISIAEDNAYNPVIDYLNGLDWDGVARIDTWLTRVFGAETSRYVSMVGRKFMVAAVARALIPGCKVDDMMILEGKQGIGKSSGMRDLVPFPDLFTDAHFDMTKARESGEALQGKWIVEMSELSVMRSAAAVERIKGFMSTETDRYRPAYGRNSRDFPRTCVFVGTTNEDEYLRDVTGNRRFWPVHTEHVNRDLLRSIRDQLWAEAVAAFKGGEKWWIEDPEVLNDATERRKAREERSGWDDTVAQYLTHSPARDERDRLMPIDRWAPRAEPLDKVTADQILRDLLGVESAVKAPPFEKKKVMGALKRLGWDVKRKWEGGHQRSVWSAPESRIEQGSSEGLSTNGSPKKRF